jgi:hypothetical protein
MNGNHLSWKTRKDNIADKHRDGTHREGNQVPGAKLNPDLVRSIRKDLGSAPQHAIGDKYGVSQMTVSLINQGKIWKHV